MRDIQKIENNITKEIDYNIYGLTQEQYDLILLCVGTKNFEEAKESLKWDIGKVKNIVGQITTRMTKER